MNIRLIFYKKELAYFFTFFQFLSCWAYGKVDKSEFLQIQRISQYLLKACPPANCILVGIGRSPTPFMAYIQGLSEIKNYAYNLPLSDFRYGVDNHSSLDQDSEKKLYHHFDQYLPGLDQVQNKSLMTVDFSEKSGHSTVAIQNYLRSYFKYKFKNLDQNAPEVKSTTIIGTSKHLTSDLDLTEEDHLDGLSVQIHRIILIKYNTRLYYNLFGRKYNHQAEYGSYDLNKIENKKEKNKEYAILVSELIEVRKNLTLEKAIQFQNKPQEDKKFPEPTEFIAIEQEGKLGTFADAKKKGRIKNYLMHLGVYAGSDRLDRLEEVWSDPSVRAELFKRVSMMKNKESQSWVEEKIIEDGNLSSLLSLSDFILRQKHLKKLDQAFENPEVLIPLVKNSDPKLRILALGEIGRRPSHLKIQQACLEVLTDQDQEVRKSAAFALAVANPKDQSLIESMLALLKHENSSIRYDVATVFAQINPPGPEFRKKLIEALIVGLKDKVSYKLEERELYRGADGMSFALGFLGPFDEKTMNELIALLQDQDPQVRQQGVQILGKSLVSDPRVREVMVQALKDPDPIVRRAAYSSILSYSYAMKVQDQVQGCLGGGYEIPVASEVQLEKLMEVFKGIPFGA